MSRLDTDIVERLRWDKRYTSGHVPVTLEDAAAEIERLRTLFPPELLMAAYQALAFVARHDPTYPAESERRAEDFKKAVRAYEQQTLGERG